MLRRALPLALLLLAGCRNAQPCPTPLQECGGSCVDIQSDPRYCGACGTPCRAGEICAAATCRVDSFGACPERVGGGFVTLGFPNGLSPSCAGQTVKLWVTHSAFLDDAVAYVGSASLDRTPLLDVVAGSDCDGQWSWHADSVTPAFVTTGTTAACATCPTAIEANVPAYVRAVRSWCPSAVRILAVERRAAP